MKLLPLSGGGVSESAMVITGSSVDSVLSSDDDDENRVVADQLLIFEGWIW
jgi:hypothetical protein